MATGRNYWKKGKEPDEEEESSDDEHLPENHQQLECHVSASGNGVVATLAGFDTFHSTLNQDRALLLHDPVLLLGVLDGHDEHGEDIAEYCQQELPKVLHQKLNEVASRENQTSMVTKALVDSFYQVNQSLPMTQGGCTASVVLKWGRKLFIANVGDSVSMVVSYSCPTKQIHVVYRTREDRPDIAEEHARIVRMGGAVESSRVVYKDADTGSLRPGLAMSRCIGNADMVGVISEPLIHVVDIDEVLQSEDATHVFCVSASDGMTDCIPPLELAKSFASAFYDKDGPDSLSVARDLVQRAAQIWKHKTGGTYRDDISVVACKIEYN